MPCCATMLRYFLYVTPLRGMPAFSQRFLLPFCVKDKAHCMLVRPETPCQLQGILRNICKLKGALWEMASTACKCHQSWKPL